MHKCTNIISLSPFLSLSLPFSTHTHTQSHTLTHTHILWLRVNEWLAKGDERKKEAEKRRQQKLERALAAPKHTFDHHTLAIDLKDQASSVSSAVQAQIKAASTPSSSSSSTKAAAARTADKPKRRVHLQ